MEVVFCVSNIRVTYMVDSFYPVLVTSLTLILIPIHLDLHFHHDLLPTPCFFLLFFFFFIFIFLSTSCLHINNINNDTLHWFVLTQRTNSPYTYMCINSSHPTYTSAPQSIHSYMRLTHDPPFQLTDPIIMKETSPRRPFPWPPNIQITTTALSGSGAGCSHVCMSACTSSSIRYRIASLTVLT